MTLLKYGVNPIFDKIVTDKLGMFDKISQSVCGREAIITSGNDGQHMKGSIHYKAKAIDLRTRDMSEHQKDHMVTRLKTELGDDWDVIKEKSHIHLEFDPK